MAEPPPAKRPRLVVTASDRYYYSVGINVIAIHGLIPDRDLTAFRGALVPDLCEDKTRCGLTEEDPLWVPPQLWAILLSAPNPITVMVEANLFLLLISVKCRSPTVLALVYDLRASLNQEAGDYWTQFYDKVVDSICEDTAPSNNCLPYPEPLVSIARYVKKLGDAEERYRTQCQYPELFTHSPNLAFPLWAVREIVTATGSRRLYLMRILRLFPKLHAAPPKQHDWSKMPADLFEKCLSAYWAYRNHMFKDTEAKMYCCLTADINNRHAILYKNTRVMFKRRYSRQSVFFFKGRYNYQPVNSMDTIMVDRATGKIVDLATAENVWTPELVTFLAGRGHDHYLPAEVVRHALRQLPTASIPVFAKPPFLINPAFVHLLNAKPTGETNEVVTTDFMCIKDVSRSELHWDNLALLAANSIGIDFSYNSIMPDALRDPDIIYTCFTPALRRVLYARDTYIQRLYFNIIEPGDAPLGAWLNTLLQSNTGSGRYYINKKNKGHWQFLSRANALHLFPPEIIKTSKRLSKPI